MKARLSSKKEAGLEPINGKGWIHYRFHGGVQERINRVIIIGAGTFVELQKGAEDLLGEQASAVFYDAGIRSGREAAQATMEELPERGQEMLEKALTLLDETALGWFKAEDLQFDEVKIEGNIKVYESFISETYGKSKKPVCHFISGFLAGFIGGLYSVNVTCEETKCSSVKGKYCVFKFERY